MGIEAGKRWFDHRTCGCNMISPGTTCDILDLVVVICIYIYNVGVCAPKT